MSATMFRGISSDTLIDTIMSKKSLWNRCLFNPEKSMVDIAVNALHVDKPCISWKVNRSGPLLVTCFNFNPSMTSNHIHYTVWDEIT